MHGIKVTVEGCTPGPIVVECPAPHATPEEFCAAIESCDSDEALLQILSGIRSLLRITRRIETEQQRQAQQLIVQGRRQAEILRIVRRLEHPPQQPHVPTTMVVVFGAPTAE